MYEKVICVLVIEDMMEKRGGVVFDFIFILEKFLKMLLLKVLKNKKEDFKKWNVGIKIYFMIICKLKKKIVMIIMRDLFLFKFV